MSFNVLSSDVYQRNKFDFIQFFLSFFLSNTTPRQLHVTYTVSVKSSFSQKSFQSTVVQHLRKTFTMLRDPSYITFSITVTSPVFLMRI